MTDDRNAPRPDDDPLDALRAALQAAAPEPDAGQKAATLRLAMENFDRLQAAPIDARQKEDRPLQAGFLNGVFEMLNLMKTRASLAVTTSVAALGLGMVLILPGDVWKREQGSVPAVTGGERTGVGQTTADGAAATETTDLDQTATVEAAPEPTLPAAPSETDDALAKQGGAALNGRTRMIALGDDAAGGLAQNAAPARSDGVIQEREEAAVTELSADAALAEPMLDEGALFETDAAAPMVAAPLDLARPIDPDTEAFANEAANPVKMTATEPVSTFSIDVDTASYAVVRSSLNMGMLPAPEAVRIEEMINYFPYDYAAPEATDAPFSSTISVMPTPWNPGTRLVQIGLQGALPAIEDRPPLNLVFLIDTSGSMEDANKLPLLKQSLALMLKELRPEDQIALVAYAGSAGEVLPPTPAGETATILTALDTLMAGGSTAGAEGIELAYQVAARMAGDGEVSRVLLATDGDFNVGISDPEALEDLIAKRRETGIYLSVLGFGRGNLDDATMQALAQTGNGQAAYIDTLSEARKVLVDQLTGTLFPIADDVKIQVEWNPATVAEYRLIGYETRALRREDFNNDAVDAGEIGAGVQVTAIYEVAAPGSAGVLIDPLRYGEAVAGDTAAGDGELGFLRLRHKAPGAETSSLIEAPILPGAPVTSEAQFAAAIAGFGQLLTGSVYLGDWGWDEAIALALSGRGADEFGYRGEAITLMRLAQSLDR